MSSHSHFTSLSSYLACKKPCPLHTISFHFISLSSSLALKKPCVVISFHFIPFINFMHFVHFILFHSIPFHFSSLLASFIHFSCMHSLLFQFNSFLCSCIHEMVSFAEGSRQPHRRSASLRRRRRTCRGGHEQQLSRGDRSTKSCCSVNVVSRKITLE